MNYGSLQGKYVLLDTNVIINFGRYRRFYQQLIDNLFEHETKLVISNVIRVELYAHVRNDRERKDIADLVMHLSNGDPGGSLLPFRKDLLDTAISLGQSYQKSAAQAGKPVQLADLLIGAEMVLYKNSDMLILATENHEDFPPGVFGRIGIATIDCENSIHNVGFYKLNQAAIR